MNFPSIQAPPRLPFTNRAPEPAPLDAALAAAQLRIDPEHDDRGWLVTLPGDAWSHNDAVAVAARLLGGPFGTERFVTSLERWVICIVLYCGKKHWSDSEPCPKEGITHEHPLERETAEHRRARARASLFTVVSVVTD